MRRMGAKGITLQLYKNHHGNSGVVSFESGNDFIKIRFKHSPVVYVYTFALPGRMHVEEMKRLASDGYGLATYISQNVKKNFDHKE
jgi:hypothetical protein